MEELNELELTLLEGLVVKHPSLKSHIPHLRVVNRVIHGNGITSELSYVNYNGDFSDINALFSNGEIIDVQNLKKGLGYVIDVTDGQITSIELNTYGEKWNGKYSEYVIVPNEQLPET